MSGQIKRIAAHAIFILFGALVVAMFGFPPTVTLQMAIDIYLWCVVGLAFIYATFALLAWAAAQFDGD